MKKIILIILLILCTGCTDYTEINDLVIISGMIIDYKNDKYEITSQLILNEDKTFVKNITTTSNSIENAISKISKYSNKNIFISHLKTLIITDNIIKNNINFYDYFLREPKAKINFNTYITDSDTAKKIFEINKTEGSALYIEKMTNINNDIYSSTTPLSFIDLVYKKIEPGIEPIYPKITIKENNNKSSLYLDHIVFFNNDNKPITLKSEDSINYNIITNNAKKTIKNIKCDNNKLFSLTLKDINTKYEWKNNKFIFNIKINADINSYECNYDLKNKKTLNKLNNIAEKQIKPEFEKLIKLSKENKSDIFGIGNYIYKHDKNYYKKINNWNYNLNNIETEIKLKILIGSSGEKRK